jgi:hypothetical protein
MAVANSGGIEVVADVGEHLLGAYLPQHTRRYAARAHRSTKAAAMAAADAKIREQRPKRLVDQPFRSSLRRSSHAGEASV